MSERLSIGADVVEAAQAAWVRAASPTPSERDRPLLGAMEAAIREALDKLGLQEEFGLAREGYDTPHTTCPEREPLEPCEHGDNLVCRLTTDWRQVDAEPVGQTGSGNRHLMEIVFGPCTREEAGDRAVDVQRLLDRRLPGMSAAVGVRYGLDRVDSEPSEPQQPADRELLVHLIACELDKPSVYMGGASQRSKRKAEAIMQIVERKSITSEGEPE